jgi:hypothetical protein
MSRRQYFVVFHEGDWKIEHKGEFSARYRTQQEALLDALNAARKEAGRGEETEVLVKGPRPEPQVYANPSAELTELLALLRHYDSGPSENPLNLVVNKTKKDNKQVEPTSSDSQPVNQ